MKILAIKENGRKVSYIAEVSHEEIEKVYNLYYNKLGSLKVDQELDLGEGYNYTTDIKATCASMQASMEKFDKTKQMLLTFASIIDKARTKE